MPTTLNLRKILDRKRWEPITPAPVASASGSFNVSSTLSERQLFVFSASSMYLYDPAEDGFLLLPASGLGGTFGAGSCGVHSPVGPSGTGLAGSTPSTLNTNLNLPGDVSAVVRITGGTGAGQQRNIVRNTYGANSVLTVDVPWTVTPDATSTYTIYSGRFYIWNAGTASTFGFRYFDTATWTWSAELAKPAVGTTWGTDGRMVATPGFVSRFADGAATAGSATTLTDTATPAWAVNQFTNMQLRIVAGTGAGQQRLITANTASVITVSAAFTTVPDATSQYVVEGNDDTLYLLGNAATAMYRYSISANAWATLAPTTARAGAPGAGLGGHWVAGVSDPRWTDEAAIINGRRIYSFRGSNGNVLDYYDIPSNAWVNGVAYQRQGEVFGAGTGYCLIGDYLYIQKDNTGRWFRFNFAGNKLDPWGQLLYPQGTAVPGDKAFDFQYDDGGTTVHWVGFQINTGQPAFRCMIV